MSQTVQRAGRVTRPILTPALSEDQIHRAIVAHLNARGRPGTFYCHPANGGARNKIEAARFVGLGVRAGVPDLVIVIGGRALFLELKREGGRVSPAQAQMHAAIRAAGAEVAVVYGFAEALNQLERWGAIR